jgi:tetratricopeptide (TPR) repeat protein
VARIDLRPTFAGSGLTGTVEPTLSWLDQQALQSIASASASIAPTLEAQGANLMMALGWMGREVADAISSLEAELGLRLDQQTDVLREQLQALERIEAALRQPAKVRAAERLVDAGKLLGQRRYERALPLAQEAMAGDPLNPAGFGAAGWSLLGLGRFDEARDHFAEAAIAAEGDERGAYTRRRARLDFGLGGRHAAENALQSFLADNHASDNERAAVQYDLAVYAADSDELQTASSFLRAAVTHDSRYALAALVDPLVWDHPPLLAVASERLTALGNKLSKAKTSLRQLASEATSFLASVPDIESISDSEPLREDMVPVQREVVRSQRVVTHLRAALAAAQDVLATDAEGSAEQRQARLDSARGDLDYQLRRLRQVAESAPRIREVRERITQIDHAIADRKLEVQRLSAQYYKEYSEGSAYTQSLTNELYKYSGRKRRKKLEERDRASNAHTSAMKRWEAIRRIEVGTDPDPEASALLEARQASLFELRQLTQPN